MSTNRPSKATAIICTKRILQELFCVYRPENHYGPWDWDLAFAECHRHRISTSSSIYPQPLSAYESASPSYTFSLPSVFPSWLAFPLSESSLKSISSALSPFLSLPRLSSARHFVFLFPLSPPILQVYLCLHLPTLPFQPLTVMDKTITVQ